MTNVNEMIVNASLISPETMAQFVANAYFTNSHIACELMSFGDNDHYLITVAGTKYALRVYRYNKYWLQHASDYLFELEWLIYLHEKGLPVAYPIKRHDGGFLGKINAPEGVRYCALFSFADGTYRDITAEGSFLLGEAVARIHLVSNEFQTAHDRLQIDLDFLLDQPLQRIKHFLGERRPKDVALVAEHAALLKSKILKLDFGADGWGIIGGDFHGWNLHFTEDNQLTLFDFDLCGYGWRAFDLAVFRWSDAGKDPNWAAFLDGYQSRRPLNLAEVEAIPLFVDIRQIWMMGSHTTYPWATRWSLNDQYWEHMISKLSLTP